MFRWLGGRFNCLRGRHVRSAAAVRPLGDTYESKCTHCGVPMRRLAKRDWIVKQ